MFPSNLLFSQLEHQLLDLVPPCSALPALPREVGAIDRAGTLSWAPSSRGSLCPWSSVRAGDQVRRDPPRSLKSRRGPQAFVWRWILTHPGWAVQTRGDQGSRAGGGG